MNPKNVITKVVAFQASTKEFETGLLAYISCTLNGSFRLNSLTLRRTLAGDYRISYPFRRDQSGKKRYFYYPENDLARRDIEHQILAALGLVDRRKSA